MPASPQMILRRHPAAAVVLLSADDPSLHPEAVARGGAVARARKQDLRPRKLEELWEGHQA